MRLVKRNILDNFSEQHADARKTIGNWIDEVKDAKWSSPVDIRRRYASADFLSDDQVIFNLKGTKYRLLVKVLYKFGAVEILRIGTHQEYDAWKL